MSNELTILALYGLLVCITLIFQASGALTQLGMGYVLSARDEPRELTGMTARIERALTNSVTALVLIAPVILLLKTETQLGADTLFAAQTFLIARLVYLPAYAFGITGLRTLAWLVGFFATGFLYLVALGLIAP